MHSNTLHPQTETKNEHLTTTAPSTAFCGTHVLGSAQVSSAVPEMIKIVESVPVKAEESISELPDNSETATEDPMTLLDNMNASSEGVLRTIRTDTLGVSEDIDIGQKLDSGSYQDDTKADDGVNLISKADGATGEVLDKNCGHPYESVLGILD